MKCEDCPTQGAGRLGASQLRQAAVEAAAETRVDVLDRFALLDADLGEQGGLQITNRADLAIEDNSGVRGVSLYPSHTPATAQMEFTFECCKAGIFHASTTRPSP